LLFDNGFTVNEIDDSSHRGAYIVVAKNRLSTESPNQLDSALGKDIAGIGDFWKSASLRVKQFENSNAKSKPFAIYGAGFYGSFLASNLSSLELMTCFIDQNPYLQGSMLMERPIVYPKDLQKNVEVIYVALNPKHSQKIIQEIHCFSERKIQYFYI
jgi:FlaA1/EpsC-like NDP-sugar epimerase